MTQYVYKLANGVEVCRSASPIQFGEGLPQFSVLEPEIIENKPAPKKKAPEPKDEE